MCYPYLVIKLINGDDVSFKFNREHHKTFTSSLGDKEVGYFNYHLVQKLKDANELIMLTRDAFELNGSNCVTYPVRNILGMWIDWM